MNRFFYLFVLFLSFAMPSYAEKTEPPPPLPVESHPASPPLFPFEDIQTTSGGEDHFMRDMMQMLLTLAMIVGIIFLITWFLKKMLNTRIQQLNTSSEIKILERRSLTPKTAIYLLEIKGKGVIIGESTNGLTHLSDFEIQASAKSPSFSQLMQEKDRGQNI